MFEDYKTKESIVIVYTGNGKGKTSAALGLLVRALGTGWTCCLIQFIKYWEVGEDFFLKNVSEDYKDKFVFYKGGKGFFKAGSLSAKGISDQKHQEAALASYQVALNASSSGKFDLVICDEISNACHDGLLTIKQLKKLIQSKHSQTSLCLTGRNFPKELLPEVDIATEMKKLKHHFDDKFLANKGIDY